jgi:hypothetical protein
MYTLVSAYGLSSSPDSNWAPATVGSMTMAEIYNRFWRLYLTLSTPVLADDIHVDFEIFRSQASSSTDTVDDFLAALSNTALQTVPEVPEFETKKISYSDAFRAGYKIDVTVPGTVPAASTRVADRTEIRIYRPNTDMRKFYEHCLVSVNGFFHRMETDDEYCYIPHGGKSLLKSRQNQMGYLNFQNIGKIKTVPITAGMVYKQENNSFLGHRAYVELNEDVEGKTVLAVIGGYLYKMDNLAFRATGTKSYCFDFNHVPVLERYFESFSYLDMSSLGLPTNVKFPDQIKIDEFFKDEHFIKYLTLPQSFFVIVDAPSLVYRKYPIRHNNFPGIFRTYKEPTLPLITGIGKVSEYWKQYAMGVWTLHVHNAVKYNRVFNSINPENVKFATDNSMPYRRYYNGQGYLLEIAADIQKP